MIVEIVQIEMKHPNSRGRYLYVVRVRQRIGIQMDYYTERVQDFGAYTESDVADEVADAIREGKIHVNVM